MPDIEDPQYWPDYYQRNQAWTLPGDHSYNTSLTPVQEKAFRSWVSKNNVPFDPSLPVSDYDMRGFWQAQQAGEPIAKSAVDPNDKQIHYPDYWKTPYSATFSNESQWANPKVAPRWKGDQYVLPNGSVLWDDKKQEAGPGFRDEVAIDPGLAELQANTKFGLGVGRAAANALNSIWDFIKVPGDVASGKYSLDEIAKMAPGYALGLAGGGIPVGAATIPSDALGIFAGAKSLTAPRTSLVGANMLEHLGHSPDEINALSGWYRGSDSLWRHTISDAGAALNRDAFVPNQFNPEILHQPYGKDVSLSDVMRHPDLFKAYPELGSYAVKSMPTSDALSGMLGLFSPETKNIYLTGGRPENMLSTLLHETQHGVQNLEGFASGGNAAQFLPEDYGKRLLQTRTSATALLDSIKKIQSNLSPEDLEHVSSVLYGYMYPEADRALARLNPELRNKVLPLARESMALRVQSQLAHDSYRRLAGEVEARAVQEQLERRDWKTPVWHHEGYIPFENQIVKTPSGEYTLTPVEHNPFAAEFIPVDHDPFVEGKAP